MTGNYVCWGLCMNNEIIRKISSNKNLIIRVFLLTFAWFALGCLYRWLNGTMVTHDSLMLDQRADFPLEISLGRFLQPTYLLFRGDVASPFVIGILGCIFTAFAALLIVKLLNMDKLPYVVAISCVMSVNITNILINATYINWFDVYSFAMLLSVVAVWCWDKYKFGFIGSAACVFVLLALYQSYIQVVFSLGLIVIILKACRGENTGRILKQTCILLTAVLVAGILYYIANKLCLHIFNIELRDNYNGLAQLGDYSGYSIVKLLAGAYLLPFQLLAIPETHFVWVVGTINIVFIIILFLGVIRILKTRTLPVSNRILIAISVILMPLAVDCVYLLSKGMVHGLMIYSFCMFYILLLQIIQSNSSIPCSKTTGVATQSWSILISILIVIIGISNVIYANGVYLAKSFETQAAFSTMSRIADRIEQTDGYVPGTTQVVFIGSLNESKAFGSDIDRIKSAFEYPTPKLAQKWIRETGLQPGAVLTHINTYRYYFNYVLGCNVTFAEADIIDKFASSKEVKNMPEFPAAESCKLIDDVMVIKLSS